MALTGKDHRAMLRGLEIAGFKRIQDASVATNPVHIQWTVGGKDIGFRLWTFEITHGGGGAAVRAADEFRIQITNGPSKRTDFDKGNYQDLLLGYSPSTDAIVAYDRRWLETWTKRRESAGAGGSPSVQVKQAEIEKGLKFGINHLTKDTQLFGKANIVTMRPESLPGYLLNHSKVLTGTMSASSAKASVPGTGTNDIVEYCASRGFSFPPEMVARYVAAFLTKPFVILAGVSGTGKSKMAELVAEFYSREAGPPSAPGMPAPAPAPTVGETFVFASPLEPNRERFALVAVRPDWIDNQSVLGYVNPITQTYESTQALDLILRASEQLSGAASKPSCPRFFMLLDEMNLAKVEHYFSDWLAASESRRNLPNGSIYQQPIPLHRSATPLSSVLVDSSGKQEIVEVPQNLTLPTNLVVTGTVNVDETTYGISPKVLDRSMVIEFDEVNLDALRAAQGTTTQGAFRIPATLQPFALATDADYRNLPAATHEHLKKINEILEEARLHFGYRSAAEISRFMSIYNQFLPESTTDVAWLRSLDIALLQKVLPRLQGNRAKLESTLVRLCAYLRDLSSPVTLTASTAFDSNATASLPKSYRRALEMLASLRDFGFVSFFK